MTLGILFWVLWIIALIFGLALHSGYIGGYGLIGGSLLTFVLFGLLGWQVFGPPVHR